MSAPREERLLELLVVSRVPEQLTERERLELNELLRHSEENCIIASQFLVDGETMTELLKVEEIADISVGRSPVRIDANQARWRLWGICALAACAALVGLVTFLGRPPVSGIDPVTPTEKIAPIAQVEDHAEAQFEREIPADGLVTNQSYKLNAGMATVRFRNGVLMTIRAPAQFELEDAITVNLRHGVMRAIVPNSGRGFTVRTPAADVKDLGTEFGIALDSASGEFEVYVFDGLINVNEPGKNTLLKALTEGDAMRLDARGQELSTRETPDGFPAPRNVSYRRWLQGSESLRQDPDLICYYTFREEGEELRDNATHSGSINGTIVGADWVSGRSPEKRALLFDDVGDQVKIQIPGEFQALGFSAWVYVTGHSTTAVPILNSDGWGPGDVHIQLNRHNDGFFASVHPDRCRRLHEAPLVETGRWMHLAAAIDVAKRTSTTWVDGQLASRHELNGVTSLRPGTCFIGDWMPGPEHSQHRRRSFKGRIDELALWSRTIDADEVEALYQAGRPSVD